MNAETVFLSLGSNQGDSSSLFAEAIEKLKNRGCTLTRSSSFYKTKAWGKTDQPDFLNAVIEIQTALPALELMELILKTEQEMGRERIEKWGPRTIDIDILFYGNQIIDTEKLVVPHPQLHLRKFVLVPLNELAPDLVHPLFNQKIKQILQECPDLSEPIPVLS